MSFTFLTEQFPSQIDADVWFFQAATSYRPYLRCPP